MDYSSIMLVRAEHDLMVKSLPSVSEYGYISRLRPRMGMLRSLLMTILNFGMR